MKTKTRRYIYGICLALGPLAVAYGIISENDWPLYVSLITAVVAPGLAIDNVTEGSGDGQRTGRRAKE